MKHVNMIGLGYIGLPTAAVMAASGQLSVTGTDINPSTCDVINQGKIHIVEPGLEDVVRSAVVAGVLHAQTSPVIADVYVIAVPTPFDDAHAPDLSYVKAACSSIAPYLQKGALVILESTSPVGTTEQMVSWLSTLRPDLAFPSEASSAPDVHVAYCPERVLPGRVLEELVSNDRLIGGCSVSCTEKAIALYQCFVRGTCRATNARTAEMAKLTENSFRDVNIAFANELSMICEQLQINVWELIQLANCHPRVNILQPGCGVGGHCIAVDPWFIVHSAPKEAALIRQARLVNDHKPAWVAQQVCELLLKLLAAQPSRAASSVRIACFGLAFKPNIDDLRESPAVDVVTLLCKELPGLRLEVVEPHVEGALPSSLPQGQVKLVSQQDALSADLKIVLVAHDAFRVEPALSGGPGVLNVAWAN